MSSYRVKNENFGTSSNVGRDTWALVSEHLQVLERIVGVFVVKRVEVDGRQIGVKRRRLLWPLLVSHGTPLLLPRPDLHRSPAKDYAFSTSSTSAGR